MRRGLFTVFIFLFISFFSITFAQELQSRESVLLPRDSTVEQDYFASGESVTIDGTVNGDAYLAGGNVTVGGTVNGDLLAAGGAVTVRGHVTEDIRVAGGTVIISGTVDGNVTMGGGSVTITDSASIGGSLVSGSGSLSVFGPIARGATFGAGSAQIGNSIGGNVIAGTGKLTLNPSANIQGNLTYYSSEKAEVQPGAIVAGNVGMKRPVEPKKEPEKVAAFISLAALVSGLLYLISLFIVGLLFLKLTPVFTQDTVNFIGKRPWASLGVGFIILILTPFIVLILLMTIVGIPLALMLLFGYFIYIYLSVIFSTLLIGQKILGYFKIRRGQVLALFVGLIAYGIISIIPFIGWFLSFLVMLAGMGALLMQKRNYYLSFRHKKAI